MTSFEKNIKTMMDCVNLANLKSKTQVDVIDKVTRIQKRENFLSYC